MHKRLLILILILAAGLRLYLLDKFPIGLNADEAAIGYNAYSLLQTGKDEHGVSWPLVFRSFDDFKPPLYFYLVLPFVKILGLNIWAVRLPSALLGIASIGLLYLLGRRLFSVPVGLVSAFLLAVSPWHLHFSRGGWEANTASFFLLLGIVLFLKALDQPKFFLFSAFSFIASLYTYHSMRVIVPLIVLALFYFYHPWRRRDLIVSSFILGLVLLLPLATQILSPEGRSRFSGVSIFADTGPLWEALSLRQEHPPSLLAQVLHNKYITYSFRFTKNYLSHFSPRFIFVTGDEIARSKVPDIGLSYLILAPFFFIGLFTLKSPFILAWLFIAPLAAALTFQSPHALRAQNMVLPLTLITAVGIWAAYAWLKKLPQLLTQAILVLATLVAVYNVVGYLHLYYRHYPRVYPYAWQAGFNQLVEYLKPRLDKYDQVIITDRYDQPYILTTFFLKYPPDRFQKELVFSERDQFGFSTGRSFGKFQFHRINWDEDVQNRNSLIVTADEPTAPNAKLMHTIYYPNGQAVFRLYETE